MTGTQRQDILLTQKRVRLDDLYKDTKFPNKVTRQIRRQDARITLKELTSIKKKEARKKGRKIGTPLSAVS